MVTDLLKNLNDKQIEAVKVLDGPLLVIAGAGSGKTRALTHRIAYLIKEHKIKPWNILAVTFTNKAANEMKERLIKLLATTNERDLPFCGTFHSTCVKILRKHIHLLGYENNFTIYDATDQEILVKRVMADLCISDAKLTPRAILSHISSAKNELIPPGEYAMMANTYFNQRVAEVYEPYQKELKKSNALDFDDLIMKTVELFNKFPEVLDYYQEKFKYILVDEYQDTNHAQYMLTNMLAQKYRNLCVIGDSDQAIYSWRGANMQNILDFEKDYRDARIIKMEQNYRSTKRILAAAHNIIVKNRKRKEKELWTENPEGAHVRILETPNERAEGELIAELIEQTSRLGTEPNYNKFVVLYRTHAQSRVLEEVFLRFGIPYKIIGGVRFYERKEIKDMIAYLRVLLNPNDAVSLLRIINVPTRKIGAKTIESIQNYSGVNNISFWGALKQAKDIELKGTKSQDIEKFVKQIEKLMVIAKEQSASGVIRHVIENIGYKDFLKNDDSVEAEARLQNVMELISVASKYDKLEPGVSLDIFLEEVSLIANIDNLSEKDNSVTLMTLHSVKGLEFPYVFITGLEEGIFPHSRSMFEPEEFEEERRLMYVGMTRAKEALYLIFAKERMLYGESQANAPSQFLYDIPAELVESNNDEFGKKKVEKRSRVTSLKRIPIEEAEVKIPDIHDGDKVMHKSFGEGIAISVTGGIVTVAFKDPKIGIKKLALSIAPLIKI